MTNANRAYNFNAGPSALPLDVLQQAERDLIDYRGSGMSIMEMSHRSDAYDRVHNEAIDAIRRLYQVPDDYSILFLQGGASLQFGMVPMNYLSEGKKAGYILTGSWSEKALKEAKQIGSTYVAATTEADEYRRIPKLSELKIEDDTAYLHITSNNTIFGTQWKEFPQTGDIPLVADMSSDIMSKPLDIRQFGLIYAGAQKNLGPSGVTVVIIRNDLLQRSENQLPTLLKYETHANKNSLYHTPPTFTIYMLGLVMEWIEKQGGVEAVEKRNAEKAQLLYDVIDESDGFYKGHAEKDSRSQMNVTFRLRDEALEKQFLAEAKEKGFVGLNGHRSVGGCRASIYNAVPMESCLALREFMLDFQKKHG